MDVIRDYWFPANCCNFQCSGNGWTCLKYFFCQYKLEGIVLNFNFLNYESRHYNFHNTQLLIYTYSTVTETSWDHNLIFCISFPMISNCLYSSEVTKDFHYQVWKCTDITKSLTTTYFKTLTHISSGYKLTIHITLVEHNICPLF